MRSKEVSGSNLAEAANTWWSLSDASNIPNSLATFALGFRVTRDTVIWTKSIIRDQKLSQLTISKSVVCKTKLLVFVK